MAYIKIYFASDDTPVSEAPETANAVTFTLRADLNEEGAWIKLYALADDGYVVSDVDVTPTGTTYLKWQLAPDDAGSPGTPEAYGDPLALGEVGDTDKVYFHVRAKATDDEEPVNDVTVTLEVDGIAAAE